MILDIPRRLSRLRTRILQRLEVATWDHVQPLRSDILKLNQQVAALTASYQSLKEAQTPKAATVQASKPTQTEFDPVMGRL